MYILPKIVSRCILLKIVVVTNATIGPKSYGGHENRIIELFTRIAENNDVHVVQIADNDQVWEKGKLKIHNTTPLKGRFGPSIYRSHFFLARYLYALRVGKVVKKLSPDVADYNSWVFPILSKSYKMVASGSVMPSASFMSRSSGSIVRKVDMFLFKYKTKKADYSIMFSRQMQDKLSPIHRKYGKKTRYVPNGVDKEIFHKRDKIDCRKKHDIPIDRKIILFSSRLAQYKRPFDYLEAMKELPDNYMGYIAGGGDLIQEIKDWIMENSMGDRIVLLGKLDKEILSEYYSASDAVVYPGEFEIQPLVPQEAMASGTIPIVSDTLGNNEIVTDRKNGLVVQLGDSDDIRKKVLEACEDQELASSLLMGGEEYMKTRDWDHSARATMEVYAEICGT